MSWCYLHAVGKELWLVLNILLQRIKINIPDLKSAANEEKWYEVVLLQRVG